MAYGPLGWGGLPALALTTLRVAGVSILFAYLLGMVAVLGPFGMRLAITLAGVATGVTGMSWFTLTMRRAKHLPTHVPGFVPAC